ncbi:GPO family capsid scaffolding protein [Curvibacter gracilis]|uniref:GPO family capsid scaffolding protein n=1 Tax=Curvibacter gracilis TaxID=230310 RepID=UPI00048968DC|nr:GPO family capsid scaffolding protein [Curvibacter gracilis]
MAQKSKLFRVATEGATTDGRVIQKDWITQMAANFDPKKYGARVWLEHYRGIAPDGLFKAYGDVIAVEARPVEDGKLALFAQIEPLPELVAMTKAKQKIYTSIEVNPKFADTGEAYLTGLAVTDSPASLGTDILAFAAQNPKASPLAGRKSHAEALFSEAIEVTLEFEEDKPEDAGLVTKFIASVKAVTEKFNGKAKSDDARFSAVLEALEEAGTVIADQAEKHATLQADHDKLSKAFATLQGQYTELVTKLGTTPEQQHSQRPPATGNSGRIQTDC